jgi:hypothetical protein
MAVLVWQYRVRGWRHVSSARITRPRVVSCVNGRRHGMSGWQRVHVKM